MDPEDASKSFWQWFREKTTSPLYLSYIVTFILWNWKFFSILFFENPTVLGVPKVIYIEQNILNHEYFLFLPYSVDVFISNRIYEFIPPVILTWIILYLLPPLANKVHKDSLKHFFNRRLEYYQQNALYKQRVLTSRTEEARLSEEISETEKKIQEAEENLSQEQKWQIEYESLQKQNVHISAVIASAERIIYGNQGYYDTSGNSPANYISISDLALLDGLGLIELNSNKIQFNEKGKAFLRIYKSQNF